MKKKIGGDEVPLDKKRRLTGKADSQSSMGRPRLPLKSVNKRQEVGAASETASVEGSECSEAEREFTKEEVEELLNKKYIEKKFDHKVFFSCQLLTGLSKMRLSTCFEM